ncbi:unnamed protein product [Meloidogyne enterolobii]|uniref:Uncharacterized protein n=1 Tax=Meloidogyne enterolobii TaxID=390850 RepID=A0ACB1AFM0_MELEN
MEIDRLSVALRSTNWQLSPKLEKNVYEFCDCIDIELHWSKNRFSSNPEAIFIQRTQIPSMEKALEYLNHVLHQARCIRRINFNVQVSTTGLVESLLAPLIGHGNSFILNTINENIILEKVCLEELFVRRRYIGQHFLKLAKLITANAKTLRVIGKIGLTEAIEGFNEHIALKRLSLINFDLVDKEHSELDNADLALTSRFYIRRLAGLGACFDHLSYTCYTGFEITRMPVLFMLRVCKVKSLRLTMQCGTAILDPPTPRVLLPELKILELVGSMEVRSDFLSRLFPSLERFDFQKQDLITGLVQRARVLSNFDFVIEPNINPIAAAC